jgi:hypothetical protein
MKIQITRVTSQGMKVRFVYDNSVLLKLLHKNIYQFVVDMIFPGNNIQRIYVSKLYECSFFEFMMALIKEVRDCNKYPDKILAKQAIKKYGQPLLFNKD